MLGQPRPQACTRAFPGQAKPTQGQVLSELNVFFNAAPNGLRLIWGYQLTWTNGDKQCFGDCAFSVGRNPWSRTFKPSISGEFITRVELFSNTVEKKSQKGVGAPNGPIPIPCGIRLTTSTANTWLAGREGTEMATAGFPAGTKLQGAMGARSTQV